MTAADHLGPQFLDLYHHTTAENAASITRSGRMTSPENVGGQAAAFFTTEPGEGAQAGGRGEGTVHLRVPGHLATLEDEFPSGEQHYSVPVAKLRRSHFVREA